MPWRVFRWDSEAKWVALVERASALELSTNLQVAHSNREDAQIAQDWYYENHIFTFHSWYFFPILLISIYRASGRMAVKFSTESQKLSIIQFKSPMLDEFLIWPQMAFLISHNELVEGNDKSIRVLEIKMQSKWLCRWYRTNGKCLGWGNCNLFICTG